MSSKAWSVAGFSVLTVISLLIAAVIGLQVAAPVVSSGATPTISGILATLLPLLGTGGGIVGVIVSLLTKSGPTIDHAIDLASGGNQVIRRTVKTGEIGVYLYLVEKSIGPEREALVTAARTLCDKLRDEMFPVEILPLGPQTFISK